MGTSVSPGPNGAGDSVGASAISRTYVNWKAQMNIRLLRFLDELALGPSRNPRNLTQANTAQVRMCGPDAPERPKALSRPRSSQP
jgi:hypothetical protein